VSFPHTQDEKAPAKVDDGEGKAMAGDEDDEEGAAAKGAGGAITWGDEGDLSSLTGGDKKKAAAAAGGGGGGWDDLNIALPTDEKGGSGSGAGEEEAGAPGGGGDYFLFPHEGKSAAQKWANASPLAAGSCPLLCSALLCTSPPFFSLSASDNAHAFLHMFLHPPHRYDRCRLVRSGVWSVTPPNRRSELCPAQTSFYGYLRRSARFGAANPELRLTRCTCVGTALIPCPRLCRFLPLNKTPRFAPRLCGCV
jgi:hypothetical protein